MELYYNPTDGGILAMMMLIAVFVGFGSFILMLCVSFRLIRGKDDTAGWTESERRRMIARKILAVLAVVFLSAGVAVEPLFLSRSVLSIALMETLISIGFAAGLTRCRWSVN